MTTAENTSVSVAAPLRESIAGWALISLFLYILNGVAFAAFTSVGGIWFDVSDALGMFLSISLMVLVVKFDELFRPVVGEISRAARWIGVIAMSLAVAGSIVLLGDDALHDFVAPAGGLGMQFLGWALLGVWFLLIARMNTRAGQFDRKWEIAAQVAGWGSVIAMAATIPLGADSPIVSAGFGVTFVAVVLWVIWTRRQIEV